MTSFPLASILTVSSTVALAGYLGSAALVLARRFRQARRRAFLKRVETTVSNADPAGAGGTRLQAVESLASEPIGLVVSTVTDPSASRLARQALAQFAVSRLGADAVRRRASAGRNPRRQIDALLLLAFSGSADAIDCLEQALANPRREVLAAAVALLGRLPDIRAAELLVDALIRNAYSRSRIATSLDAFPLDIRELLTPLLASPDGQVRYWGVLLMRRYPDAEGLPRRLMRLTADAQPSVRKAALEAIGSARYSECINAMYPRLTDRIPFVRAHAARAIGTVSAHFGPSAVVPLLADRKWLVRSAAKQSLEAMGPGVAPLLMGMLSHKDPFARNGAAEVLQNLGVFETLVARHASAGTDTDTVRELRVLAGAAGPRMWNTVLLRLDDTARERARRLRAVVLGSGAPDV
jgi:HEAT repeat protein